MKTIHPIAQNTEGVRRTSTLNNDEADNKPIGISGWRKQNISPLSIQPGVQSSPFAVPSSTYSIPSQTSRPEAQQFQGILEQLQNNVATLEKTKIPSIIMDLKIIEGEDKQLRTERDKKLVAFKMLKDEINKLDSQLVQMGAKKKAVQDELVGVEGIVKKYKGMIAYESGGTIDDPRDGLWNMS